MGAIRCLVRGYNWRTHGYLNCYGLIRIRKQSISTELLVTESVSKQRSTRNSKPLTSELKQPRDGSQWSLVAVLSALAATLKPDEPKPTGRLTLRLGLKSAPIVVAATTVAIANAKIATDGANLETGHVVKYE